VLEKKKKNQKDPVRLYISILSTSAWTNAQLNSTTSYPVKQTEEPCSATAKKTATDAFHSMPCSVIHPSVG
jgi:hypothetical protein